MTTTRAASAKDDAGIWITLRESSPPVRAVLAGIFVNQLGAFLQVYLVLFLIHQGFTAVQAGFALGALGAGTFAGVLAGGAFADRLGARWATLTSMVGFAVLLVVVQYIHSFPGLIATVVGIGVIGRFYRPAAAALLSELTPKHRQVMIFALSRLMSNIGTTAAPLAGALIITVSYHLLFWIDAVTSLGYAVIAATFLPRRAAARRRADVAGPAAANPTGGYRVVLRDRRYVLFLLAILVNAIVYLQYVSALPLTMKAAGLAIVWYSAAISLNGFIVITCELLVTKVTQRLPTRQIVVAGFALLGGGMALYSLRLGVGIFLVGTLLWTLAEIVGGPTLFAYPGRVAPEGYRARYIGSMQTMFSLGTAIGPVVGISVYHLIGNGVWVGCGLASLLGMGLALAGIRPVDAAPRPAKESV